MVSIEEIKKQIKRLSDEVTSLEDEQKKEWIEKVGMNKTFTSPDASYITGKLDQASGELTKAENEADAEKKKDSVIFALDYLNAANVHMTIELSDASRERARIITEQKKKHTQEAYNKELEMYHEKFMGVVTGITEVVKLVSKLGVLSAL